MLQLNESYSLRYGNSSAFLLVFILKENQTDLAYFHNSHAIFNLTSPFITE